MGIDGVEEKTSSTSKRLERVLVIIDLHQRRQPKSRRDTWQASLWQSPPGGSNAAFMVEGERGIYSSSKVGLIREKEGELDCDWRPLRRLRPLLQQCGIESTGGVNIPIGSLRLLPDVTLMYNMREKVFYTFSIDGWERSQERIWVGRDGRWRGAERLQIVSQSSNLIVNVIRKSRNQILHSRFSPLKFWSLNRYTQTSFKQKLTTTSPSIQLQSDPSSLSSQSIWPR